MPAVWARNRTHTPPQPRQEFSEASQSPLTEMAELVSKGDRERDGGGEQRCGTVYVLHQPFLGVRWVDGQRSKIVRLCTSSVC